jgi:hypothetical protein
MGSENNYSVVIDNPGMRAGTLRYVEAQKELDFYWEIDGPGIVIPSAAEWDAYCDKRNADWAKGRYREIIDRVAEEVRQKKAPSAKVQISEKYIAYIFERPLTQERPTAKETSKRRWWEFWK